VSDRETLVRLALGEVGESYAKHRDCSGFTAWAYRQIGVTIPEGSVAQFSAGFPVVQNTPLKLGDLLFWDTFGPSPGHVALYVGNGQVVHALNERRGIVQSATNADMGGPYVGTRRILVDDVTEPEAPAHPKHRRRRKRRREER
jgi:cell wall-associated NlpC family hydrolase